MSKNTWVRAEHALLLRAWQDVLEQDAADNNLSSSSDKSPTSKSKSKDESKSKAAVGARVYERFIELTDGKTKRTLNSTTLQRAALSFNFSFILQYNLTHGANAWVSLSRDEREQIYNREKTTSYYFVDLDPDMTAALTAIRKHIASGSAKAAAASGYGLMPTPGKSPKKRGPKPKIEAGNARGGYRAIIGSKGSDENDEGSESSSSSDSSSDDRAENKRKKKKHIKTHRYLTKPVKRSKSDQAALIDALDSLKKEIRRMQKVILRGDQHAEPAAGKMKKRNGGDEKTRRPQGSKLRK